MSFYQEISAYYDIIFPVETKEMAFVQSLLPKDSSILDLGCGTGNKTIFLAEIATQVEAVDLDSAMIAKAISDNARPNIRYQNLHMGKLSESFAGKKFDAITCLGNTLVHLPAPEQIQDALTNIASFLKPAGSFILQILNYDRILNHNLMNLPTLQTERIKFSRRYNSSGKILRFMTTLEDKYTGRVLYNDIPLYPLRKNELTSMLTKAGLSTLDFYGSYQGDTHNEDSFVTIVHCKR